MKREEFAINQRKSKKRQILNAKREAVMQRLLGMPLSQWMEQDEEEPEEMKEGEIQPEALG